MSMCPILRDATLSVAPQDEDVHIFSERSFILRSEPTGSRLEGWAARKAIHSETPGALKLHPRRAAAAYSVISTTLPVALRFSRSFSASAASSSGNDAVIRGRIFPSS